MGMPVLVLATTKAVARVPAHAGGPGTRAETLVGAARWLMEEPDTAATLDAGARRAALARYGLDRFIVDRDRPLEEETCGSP